jgi:hypothetical protein
MRHEVDDPGNRAFWVGLFQEAALTLRIIREVWHVSIAYVMGTHSDLTLGTAPIQLRETHGGRDTSGNDIRQHLAGSDTGELIDIANQHQARS